MVIHSLRQCTSAVHARVESKLELLDPKLSVDRLASVISRFYGFWAVGESAIDAWSATHPEAAMQVEWPRRRRSHLLVDDLELLGSPRDSSEVFPSSTPVFQEIDSAQVFGWLYVAEGSTLGGAIIERHLQSLPGLAALHLRSFTPYAEGAGPMWYRYRSALEDFAGGNVELTRSVMRAALTTFESFERWIQPLGVGAMN
jgi:heme oxygenase